MYRNQHVEGASYSLLGWSILKTTRLKLNELLQKASYLNHECWGHIILSQRMVGGCDVVTRNNVWKASGNLLYLQTIMLFCQHSCT